MAADMMHVTKEDLVEEVDEIIGAMEFLEKAEGAQLLFIKDHPSTCTNKEPLGRHISAERFFVCTGVRCDYLRLFVPAIAFSLRPALAPLPSASAVSFLSVAYSSSSVLVSSSTSLV